MKPEELQRLENLEKEIQDLKQGLNIDIAAGLERNLSQTFMNVRNRSGVTNDDVKVTATIGMGGGTVDILDYPDRWIYVYIDEKLHRVGAWLEENDAGRSYGS